MPQYRELKAYKSLERKMNALMDYLNKTNDDLAGVDLFAIEPVFETLKNRLLYYYALDEEGQYKRLTKGDINSIKDIYKHALNTIRARKGSYINRHPGDNGVRYFDDIEKLFTDDMSITDRLDSRDNLSLPASAYKFNKELKKHDYDSGNFKWPGFYEYSRIYASDKKKTEADILDEFIKKTPKQVEETYKKAVENSPHLYEYINVKGVIPANIANTSDVDKIDEFLAQNLDKLTYPQQVKLRKQIEVSNKIKDINEACAAKMNNNEELGKKPEVSVKGNDSAELKIKMPAYQTSGQGCWSCAMQMMAASRGHKVTQEDIRGYRPKLEDNDVVVNNDETDYAYNSDGVKNLMGMADSLLAFTPNTMLHEVAISKYSPDTEKRGITREKYIDDTVALMKKYILHAIKVDRSPVALLMPGHYVTITGIDGDIIKYKDSKEHEDVSPNHTYTMSLTSFLKQEYGKTKDDPKQVAQFQLSWISDIKLSKDNKTIYGVPSVYAGVSGDGSLILPPDEVGESANTEVIMSGKKENGARIYRLGGDERANVDAKYDPYKNAGVEFVDKVYMPKKLNYNYLKNMAKDRSNKEEEILKAADKNVFGIPENREAAKKEINDFINNIVPDVEEDEIVLGQIAGEVAEGEKIGIKTIRDMARRLYDSLNKHQHFYLSGKKQAYADMLSNLYEILRIADNAIKTAIKKDDKINPGDVIAAGANKNAIKEDDSFKPKDVKDLLESFDDAIISAKSYLNQKLDEFEANPGRKNASGKQKNEQPRIKAAIDAYETLSKYRGGFLKVLGNKTFTETDQMDVERIASGYRKALVSEYKETKRLQKKTYYNSIDIPDFALRPIERMEAIWGRNTEMLKEFENKEYFDTYIEVNEKTEEVKEINTFRKLKSCDSNMIGIGEGGKNDMLSNKDFVALACAASTTRSIFDMGDAGTKVGYAHFVEEDTEYLNYGHLHCEATTGVTMPHFITPYIDKINASKDMVKKAMTQYEAGNLSPLALIIKEGITNLTKASRSKVLFSSESELYMGEICQRMVNMLNRDNDLMKEVLKQGLSPDAIKHVEVMKEVGLQFVKARGYYNQMVSVGRLEEKKIKEWSHGDKIERYTDMILSEVYMGIRGDITDEINRNPDYIRENKVFADKCEAELNRLEKDVVDYFGRNFMADERGKSLYNDYNNKIKAAGNIIEAEEKKRIIRNAEIDVYGDIKKYMREKIEQYRAYETNLLEKYKDMLKDRRGLTDRNAKLKECIRLERQQVTLAKVARSKEQQERFEKAREDFGSYEMFSAKVTALAVKVDKEKAASSDFTFRKAQVENVLYGKYMPADNMLDELGRHTNVESLRKRVREYVIGNGFDKYSMKDFAKKVYSQDEPGSVHYGKPFSYILAEWELNRENEKKLNKQIGQVNDIKPAAEQKAPENEVNKQVKKANNPNPDAEPKVPKNAANKEAKPVRKNVRGRKGSAKVNKNTVVGEVKPKKRSNSLGAKK